MVKFSKELEAQLIPEWKDAFVNYWLLKKSVKKIKLSRNPPLPKERCDFQSSLLHPIRYFSSRIAAKFCSGAGAERADVIQVRSEEDNLYRTHLIRPSSETDEVKDFFERLDEELNKVNLFYKSKEREFLERGENLEKQLQLLVQLKQILHERRRKIFTPDGATCPLSNSSSARGSDISGSGTESEDPPSDRSPANDATEAVGRNGLNFVGSGRPKAKKGKPKTPVVRIDIPATTPTRAITAITSMLWEDLVSDPKTESSAGFVTRKKIERAEKMIRGAFVELYRGLGLLKTYSNAKRMTSRYHGQKLGFIVSRLSGITLSVKKFAALILRGTASGSLNMVAFTKILKKFDKVANQQASATYLKAVKKSHFISSDKVARLADEVETIFTTHFANNDRKKAMKFLRPQQHKASHMITFLVGLFTGCFVTFFSLYAILANLSGMFSTTTKVGYMETVYPVFSVFVLLSLHIFLYGCNLFLWRSTRINYNFIFEFSPSTGLKYRDVFLICTSIMTVVVGGMVFHLLLRWNGFSPRHVDALPGILILLFTGLLICPLNIFYRSTRYCFLRVIRNIICAPFYKVWMADFFMADQLTSQIPLLRHMEFTACYFIAGHFETHQYGTCTHSKLYKELAYVISFLPYYWRAMQCARRWFDEGDINHVANLGKYVSAMLAAGARLTYAMQPTPLWSAIVIVTSSVATVYQLYWDFVKDWGLLNPKSKNPWLRDELILKHNGIYYASIALNFVLRLAWVETVMHLNVGVVEYRLLDFLLASLEIIRRGHWNFYRLENEHLNNVGKFRVVKAVPLPFREIDSD